MDTNVFVWWLQSNPSLAAEARDQISDPQNSIFVSAASFWEIIIKKSLGKLRFEKDLIHEMERNFFEPLPITPEHVMKIERLPLFHKDPFDRILIAQAQYEKLTLIATDEQILRYDVPTLPGT